MKKIPNKVFKRLEDLYLTLEDKQNNINDKIEEINTLLEKKISNDLSDVIENYNQVIREINEVREELYMNAEQYYESRSEKWIDSERGQIFCEWKDNLEEQHEEIDEPDIEMIEELDYEELYCPEKEVPYE